MTDRNMREIFYKSLKTPVSIVFQKSVDNFMGTDFLLQAVPATRSGTPPE